MLKVNLLYLLHKCKKENKEASTLKGELHPKTKKENKEASTLKGELHPKTKIEHVISKFLFLFLNDISILKQIV